METITTSARMPESVMRHSACHIDNVKEFTGMVVHEKGVLQESGRAPIRRPHMRAYFQGFCQSLLSTPQVALILPLDFSSLMASFPFSSLPPTPPPTLACTPELPPSVSATSSGNSSFRGSFVSCKKKTWRALRDLEARYHLTVGLFCE